MFMVFLFFVGFIFLVLAFTDFILYLNVLAFQVSFKKFLSIFFGRYSFFLMILGLGLTLFVLLMRKRDEE